MKVRKRILSVLLAASMLFSASAPAWAAGEEGGGQTTQSAVTGEIRATLRLDYAQNMKAIKNHNVQAFLKPGPNNMPHFDEDTAVTSEPGFNLWEIGKVQTVGSYSATVIAKNRDGGIMEFGEDNWSQYEDRWPGYLELAIDDLPQGEYTLTFYGIGYATFSQNIEIKEYSQHLVIGTGDNTFTLGDLTRDGRVDQEDLDIIETKEYLSTPPSEADLNQVGFNGDGVIDVIDLAYVKRSSIIQPAGENVASDAVLNNTVLLVPPVDTAALAEELKKQGVSVENGDLNDLFVENGQGVQLTSAEEKIQLPLEFSTPKDVEQIVVNAPNNNIGAKNVSAEVTYEENGKDKTETFEMEGAPLPADIHAIGRAGEDSKSIVINLGKRVPVKKITISVEKTASGHVAVESIQFLKDIVPENPVAPNRMVKNLKAEAGSEKVDLRWSELPNVTGYRVSYWEDGADANKKELSVDVPYAEVSGLENLKTYCFQVVPTADNGKWQGDYCGVVKAMPEPDKAPDAPDMVSVQELEGKLAVSWKKSKAATYYQVFYKEKEAPDSAYQQAGGDLTATSVTIESLENETTYSIYIIAGNDIGKSGRSRIAEGTPKAVKYDGLDVPKDALLDSGKIKSVRLADPNNYAPGEYTAEAPFKANFLIDNNLRTHWTARNWAGNEHVICEFTEPVDLQAVIWAPRLDGNYPNQLRAYSIQVWYKGEEENAAANKNGHLLVPDPNRGGVDNNGGSGGGDVHTWPNIPNRTQIPISRYAVLPFDPQKEVIQISVAVEQAGYQLVSCSELMFMEYNPAKCLPDQIQALFADELRTQLASGATADKIAELKAKLEEEKFYYFNIPTLQDELALAEELLNKKPSGKSTIVENIQSRSNGADSQKYGQAGSDLQPLGATATAGQEITVYASGIPENQSVALYASQFNAEASAWRATIGQVKNGRNIFTVPKIGSQNTQRGGSLYLGYSGDNPGNIKLHVRRATDIPVLELADWYKIDESTRKTRIEAYLTELDAYVTARTEITATTQTTSIFNVTEISTPVVLLSLPAKAVQNGTVNSSTDARVQQVYNSVLAWEDLMHICKTTQGIDNTYKANDMQSRQNIRCMQMFAGAFMYAAGNHIGIGYGSCAGMVGGTPIKQMGENFTANNLFGWGIAHEIGHNMDKLGKAEITNNIYSIMAQTYDGKDNTLSSRLEKSNKYPRIFEKVAQGYPGASNDVFAQLGMYWQLHLAYDGGKATTDSADNDGPMNFYNKFFKAWKAGTYTKDFPNASSDEKFALTASAIANKNLTEFFTRWGMTLSKSVTDKLGSYPAETRAIWYLSDQSRRDRLEGVKEQTGDVSASAAKKTGSDTEIEIKIIPPASDHIQGYEIIRNNKPIDFVTPKDETKLKNNVYTDTIGSGNHLTFNYKVVAYDTLGNVIGEDEAGEVRVAYDKTVAPDAYTLIRSEDKTTATFKLEKETAVSGIKLKNAGQIVGSSAFTIKVTDAASKETVARQDTFDHNLAVDDSNSFLTYFQKPGAGQDDTRIWTYDAKTVVITGLPADLADENIQLVSYAGDDVSFLEDSNGFVGRLSADYPYGDGADDVIKAGTLVIIGNYRGDPVYNTISVQGKFTITKASADPSSDPNSDEEVTFKEETRPLDGYALMFAEIPADGEVSDISDGLFIFVPNVQKEAELQEISHCDGANLLPSQIKVEMYRTDDPNNAASKRKTAETLWIHSPGGDELPTVTLKQNQEVAK